MRDTILRILVDFSKNLKPKLIKSSMALKFDNFYYQYFFYDGLSNSFKEDFSGLHFDIDSNIEEIINNEEYYNVKIKKESYSDKYWWLFNDLELDEVYIFIKNIYSPLINLREPISIVILISETDISEEAESLFNEIYIEISDSIYELSKSMKKNLHQALYLNSFARMLESIDPLTYNHSLRVADLATILTRAAGYDDEKAFFIRNCALIHDLGKIWIPKDILYKGVKLTHEEEKIYQTHTDKLETIFSGNIFMSEMVKIAKYHHEYNDGTGYYGLKEKDIPYETKIIIISNLFDHYLNGSPREEPKSLEITIKELESLVNKNKIDPDLFNIVKTVFPDFFSGIQNINLFSSIGFTSNVFIQDVYNKDIIIHGNIIDTFGNIINVSTVTPAEIKNGSEVSVQCNMGGLMENYRAKIISKSTNTYTLILEKDISNKEKFVKIMWSKSIIITKISDFERDMDSIDLYKNISFKGEMRILGANHLIFASDKEILSTNEKVLITFEAFGEILKIPGYIKDVKFELSKYKYYVDYFDMSEKNRSLIFRSIFKKQIELKMGIR